ncbi:cytochrome ubiquinol oxidase subunit I [Bifidobacterium sp. ESL0745]|uniref:cytochrome ubiquinol oxidase subunit I n=1 Tax=Bifidobacterium sp. ESL0745 TaxID=2983226 RepID=UPI0023F65CD5|nr:cytochrome ubiquinol oxidase subunit I [Bifidobacterium sp. ESL0745]MDF7665387.1 cytochrome ubiquinol oxidase subunit I [Bifidobacterium sp. ESL0745]
MTILGLSRFQFAMTTVFHFFFVPLTIGLSFTVAVMETLYVAKRKYIYKRMAQFWGKIFLLSFAVGIVTGIIQEFQFGMNWSNYSRFMGDIFGAPLAIEALLAFFMESTFVGVWMFTWNRFKPGLHVVFIWLTWLGSTVSAIWILAANSFMQNPVGYGINKKTGHAEMTNFAAVIGNPQLWREFPHVATGALMLGGMVVVGMSAFGFMHKNADRVFFTRSIRVGAIIALIGSILVIITGDLQTLEIIKDQPMKFAATEGIYEDLKSPAPWMVVGLINEGAHKSAGIEIPGMLSLLAFHKLYGGTILGMNTLNEQFKGEGGKIIKNGIAHPEISDYYVPTNVLFWSFRFMAAVGFAVLILAICTLWFTRKSKNTLADSRWKLWVLGVCTYLPFIGTTGGWLITELGRYPWIVYGLQTIADAVSPTATVPSLLFTNIVYFLLFCLMGGVMIFYSRRTLRQGPEPDPAGTETEPEPKAAHVGAHAANRKVALA